MADNDKLKIKIIIGSIRKSRFGDKAAQFIFEETKKRDDMNVEIIDLMDYPLPLFNEPISPSRITTGKYDNPVVQKWADKIGEADGYIIVTPEYNHGYPAALKNALDHVYYPWNKKAVGFVAYGSVGGARSVEQLREVTIELQMAPIRTGIHIPFQVMMEIFNKKEGDKIDHFLAFRQQAGDFLSQLAWWTRALKNAREAEKSKNAPL
ncbi:MAG: NAD(P)H-dependent oxidoreductase [Patescibacteria group bacterium]|nr:NAD(P)H-dependent oxidoreductase [Patescibacteria group bacterium]